MYWRINQYFQEDNILAVVAELGRICLLVQVFREYKSTGVKTLENNQYCLMPEDHEFYLPVAEIWQHNLLVVNTGE